ncbi:hypothetical protein SALBM217S_04705 [Streptomyces griseoloalbus]
METMQKVAPHHVASVRRHFIDLRPRGAIELDKALKPIAEHLRGSGDDLSLPFLTSAV